MGSTWGGAAGGRVGGWASGGAESWRRGPAAAGCPGPPGARWRRCLGARPLKRLTSSCPPLRRPAAAAPQRQPRSGSPAAAAPQQQPRSSSPAAAALQQQQRLPRGPHLVVAEQLRDVLLVLAQHVVEEGARGERQAARLLGQRPDDLRPGRGSAGEAGGQSACSSPRAAASLHVAGLRGCKKDGPCERRRPPKRQHAPARAGGASTLGWQWPWLTAE
jgi:hypothetical protein